MKSILFVIITTALYLFTSCAQKPKNGKWEIKTNLVNGTINAAGTDLGRNCGSTIYWAPEGHTITYDLGCIECEDFKITIDTTYLSLEDYYARYAEGIEMVEEEKGDNYRFFLLKYLQNINRTTIAGEVISADSTFTNGYKFLVYKQGKTKNYILEGDDRRYKSAPPIYDRETAMKALEIAQSFQPAD